MLVAWEWQLSNIFQHNVRILSIKGATHVNVATKMWLFWNIDSLVKVISHQKLPTLFTPGKFIRAQIATTTGFPGWKDDIKFNYIPILLRNNSDYGAIFSGSNVLSISHAMTNWGELWDNICWWCYIPLWKIETYLNLIVLTDIVDGRNLYMWKTRTYSSHVFNHCVYGPLTRYLQDCFLKKEPECTLAALEFLIAWGERLAFANLLIARLSRSILQSKY